MTLIVAQDVPARPAPAPVNVADAEPHVPPALGPGRHIPALDGVRGIAILLVMFTHFIPIDRATVASRLLGKVGSMGWCGVDLFFVLSGFLITGILFDAKGAPGYFRNFYARRTLRIFPLYYGVLLVSLILLPAVSAASRADIAPIARHQWSLWLYCSNIDLTLWRTWLFGSPSLSMNHFWSLAVEEQFYLVWPLLVCFCSRRTLIAFCAIACVVALALRCYWGTGPHFNPMAFYVLTPSRMDALAAGAFVALILRGGKPVGDYIKTARRVAVLSGLAVVGVYFDKQMWSTSVLAVRTVGLSFLAIFFAAVLLLIVTASSKCVWHAALSHRWLRLLGKYSYGIYVFHAMFLPLFDRFLSFEMLQRYLHSVALAQLAQLLIDSTLSIAIALVSWHLFEKHFLKLKRFFEYRTAPAAAFKNGSR